MSSTTVGVTIYKSIGDKRFDPNFVTEQMSLMFLFPSDVHMVTITEKMYNFPRRLRFYNQPGTLYKQ